MRTDCRQTENPFYQRCLPRLSSASSPLCDFNTKSHGHSRIYKRCCRDGETEGRDSSVFEDQIDVASPSHVCVCCVCIELHMCCFPAPNMRYNGVQEEAESMKDRFSASSVLFKYSVCNEKVNQCPSAGVSVSRAILTGLKQRRDTWHLKISSAEPSPEGFSYQSRAGQTGRPLMTAGVCVCDADGRAESHSHGEPVCERYSYPARWLTDTHNRRNGLAAWTAAVEARVTNTHGE